MSEMQTREQMLLQMKRESAEKAAKRALRRADPEERVAKVGLAMFNAEREHHMLSQISNWDDLTDAAQEHYGRLARAAIAEMRSES